MGHELTHGFDNLGRQYDKEGNKISWWTDETIKAFDDHKTCIIDQYSNYTVSQVDKQVTYESYRFCLNPYISSLFRSMAN